MILSFTGWTGICPAGNLQCGVILQWDREMDECKQAETQWAHDPGTCPWCRREGILVDRLVVGDACIQFSSVVKLLGYTLSLICLWRSKFPPLSKPVFSTFSRVHSLLGCETANAIAICLIQSKLDYCNSLLVGLPQTQIKRLQAVQKAAARVMVRQKKYDHITPLSESSTGCLCMKVFSISGFLSLMVPSMKTCHSISLSSFHHTLHFVLSDRWANNFLMFQGL